MKDWGAAKSDEPSADPPVSVAPISGPAYTVMHPRSTVFGTKSLEFSDPGFLAAVRGPGLKILHKGAVRRIRPLYGRRSGSKGHGLLWHCTTN